MAFDFGADVTETTETVRAQLASPLDVQSQGLLTTFMVEKLPELNRVQSLTLRSGDTVFDVRGTDNMSLTSAAAVSISTITSGYSGQMLTLIFNDANVTLVHDATGTRGTLNLGGNNILSATNTTLQLIHDGTSWKAVTDVTPLEVITQEIKTTYAPIATGSTGIIFTAVSGIAVIQFPDAGAYNSQFSVGVPVGRTAISSILILYYDEAVGNLYVTFDVSVVNLGSAGNAITQDTTDSYTTYAASGGNVTRRITVPAGAYNGLGALADGMVIGVSIDRDAAQAADTYNAAWKVFGVEITFT